MNDEEYIARLRECDFFAGDKEIFYNSLGNAPRRIHGARKEPAPLVSVIITTYKRPQWLEVALDSALRQEGFDDYEILVVDNEGAHPDTETETSRLVCSRNDEKVVYYRNFPTVSPFSSIMNTAVSLSRSKWICIVHDDDIMSKDHLRRMTDSVREHPEVGYLACASQSFDTGDEAAYRARAAEDVGPSSSLTPYPPEVASLGCWPGWIGALIDRENYIGMGGMHLPFSVDMADLIMVVKHMDRCGGTYRAKTDKPLYYLRTSMNQGSAGGSDMWFRLYAAEFMFYKYLVKRRGFAFPRFWNFAAGVIIHDKIRGLNRQSSWLKGGSIDMAALERLTGLSAGSDRGMLRWIVKRLVVLMRRYYFWKSPA